MSALKQRLARIEDAIRPKPPKDIDRSQKVEFMGDHMDPLTDAQLDRLEQLIAKACHGEENKHQPLDAFLPKLDPDEMSDFEIILETMRFDCSDRHPAWCEWRHDA